MLPWRPDATAVQNLSSMRRIMPYISPRRNDSVFYMYQDIGVDAALEFVAKKNEKRPPERPLTLFHLVLRACSQALVLRPGVNRFVKAGKLWQRDGEYLTFSAKRELADGSPMLTVKRRFHADTESLEEMVDGIYERLNPQRAGQKTQADKETNLLLLMPGPLVMLALGLVKVADYFGLLPRGMIEADPLYTSLFLANLGSIDYPAGHHHLWEYGSCSLFGVMGRIEPTGDGRRKMKMAWTYDERIEDGLYSYHTLEGIRERIESPELLELSTADLAARASEGLVR